MKKIFDVSHPAVIFTYFTAVLAFTMAYMHPFFLLLSVCGATFTAVYLEGSKAGKYLLAFGPVALIAAAVNPLFNHEGGTILAYFGDGNPLTMESILFGIGAAAMLTAVMLWFFVLNRVMTMEKIMVLFGRLAPGLALLFSMAVRFTARFRAQFLQVRRAAACMGTEQTGRLGKLREAAGIISVMVTWSFENGIDTADAMKSRGYGLPGRSSFSPYRFTKRDGIVLGCILTLCGVIVTGIGVEGIYYTYFPFFRVEVGAWTAVGSGAFLLLCFLPIMLDRMESSR